MASGDEQVWIEVEWTVLEPGARANSCPADTREVPYRARARGVAPRPVVGQEAEIVTVTGRRLRGQVRELHPGYEHTFGRPLPEWVRMKNAIRALVRRADSTTKGAE